jgi:hypothetical protein
VGWFDRERGELAAKLDPKPAGAPTGKPTKDPRPTIGEVNVLEASVGQRGAGKSTLQCERAYDLSVEFGGAYVIGHSLGGRLPRALPDGTVLPIEYHESIARLERGLRRRPDRWHILAPPIDYKGHRDTCDELLQFVVRFSESVKRDAWRKLHPFGFYKSTKHMGDVHATPTIVLIDEGIAVEAAGPSRKDRNTWFLEFLYSLRHMHVALLYAIQDASARSWRVLEQATAIHVFSIRHAWALQSIQAAGATPAEIERIRHLPTPAQLKSGERKHEHVTLAFDAPTTETPPESMTKD